MLKNVIILTCGQSGSSVLTALIARAGYWVGDETKKVGWDTFENHELVDFDREILKAAHVDWDDLGSQPSPPPLERIRALADKSDARGVRSFLEKCEAHRPWIWKDPRLCYTINYWDAYLDLSECSFIIMGRSMRQAWTGHILKGRFVTSLAHYAKIHQGLLDEAERYVRERDLPHLMTTFEDLMLEPARVLAEVNEFLGTELSLDDLHEAYHGPLRRLRYSRIDYLHAWLRYQTRRWIRGTH